ncbi:protein kinase [Kitasatospora sp. NPDC057198]|uniref:protein kinase domain-containing protein n=1 Tax=Kitasatospora sp. NPDC057198 TaxID=3346046 RepID=UPI00363EF7F4
MPGWQNLGPLLPTGKPFVRRARRAGTGEEAVLKFLADQREARQQRFFAEARRMNGMTSTPGVLPVLDIDRVDEERPQWYVMPLAEGLRDVLERVETLQDVVAPFVVLADTLAELESQRIYHRDIKPDNLFWHGGGPVLADFGIAYWGDAGPTHPEEKVGPAGFMAPEMYTAGAGTGEVGAGADVYSLAQTLYVVARREGPYPPGGPLRADEEVYSLRQWQDTPSISGLRHVLEAATQVTQASRLTMAEFASQLRTWLELEQNLPIEPSKSRLLRLADLEYMLREHQRDQQATERTMENALNDLADEYFARGDEASTEENRIFESTRLLGGHAWPERPPNAVGVDSLLWVSHVEDPETAIRAVLAARVESRYASFAIELQQYGTDRWEFLWQSRTTSWHQMRLPSVQQELAGLIAQATAQLENHGY